MLEKYGIRRDKRIRLYTQEECDESALNYFYLALYFFDRKEYEHAKRCANLSENTQQGPLAKFVSGISSFELGETKLAITKLVDFCLTLTDRTFVKNPIALRSIAEEILVRLIGTQIGHIREDAPEKEHCKEIMEELGSFSEDINFTPRLSYQTQLKTIDYLYAAEKILEETYERERDYIVARIMQSQGLDLKAVAGFINAGYEGSKKAQAAVAHLVGFNPDNEPNRFTDDRFLFYKTIESMHANGLIDTETYVSRLRDVQTELAKKCPATLLMEADDSGLSSSSEDNHTTLSEGVEVDLSSDASVIVAKEPLPFDPKKFLDTINRQLLLHDTQLHEKEAAEDFCSLNPGPKIDALKERALAQNIIRTYYKDVWNTVGLSHTAPRALAILFYIPRAIVTALSTLALPFYAGREKWRSTETRLEKLAEASIVSKLRREFDRHDKCHGFFKPKALSAPASIEREEAVAVNDKGKGPA